MNPFVALGMEHNEGDGPPMESKWPGLGQPLSSLKGPSHLFFMWVGLLRSLVKGKLGPVGPKGEVSNQLKVRACPILKHVWSVLVVLEALGSSFS